MYVNCVFVSYWYLHFTCNWYMWYDMYNIFIHNMIYIDIPVWTMCFRTVLSVVPSVCFHRPCLILEISCSPGNLAFSKNDSNLQGFRHELCFFASMTLDSWIAGLFWNHGITWALVGTCFITTFPLKFLQLQGFCARWNCSRCSGALVEWKDDGLGRCARALCQDNSFKR